MVPQPSYLQVWLSESDLGLVMRFVNRPEVCLRGGQGGMGTAEKNPGGNSVNLGFYTGKLRMATRCHLWNSMQMYMYIYIYRFVCIFFFMWKLMKELQFLSIYKYPAKVVNIQLFLDGFCCYDRFWGRIWTVSSQEQGTILGKFSGDWKTNSKTRLFEWNLTNQMAKVEHLFLLPESNIESSQVRLVRRVTFLGTWSLGKVV